MKEKTRESAGKSYREDYGTSLIGKKKKKNGRIGGGTVFGLKLVVLHREHVLRCFFVNFLFKLSMLCLITRENQCSLGS